MVFIDDLGSKAICRARLRNKNANALTNRGVRQRGTFSASAEIVQNQQPNRANCQAMILK